MTNIAALTLPTLHLTIPNAMRLSDNWQVKAEACIRLLPLTINISIPLQTEKSGYSDDLEGRLDERSLAGNHAYGSTVREYRERLINWFREDGYEQPLDGNRWKEFPPPFEPENPDADQLFQDGRSASDQFPPGYSPHIDPARRR